MTSPYGSNFDGEQWPWTLDGEPDWYALHDASGRYVSDACVEGSTQEWREISKALRSGRGESFKRLRAAHCGDHYEFCSPRNTMGGVAHLPIECADTLADIIDAALSAAERSKP